METLKVEIQNEQEKKVLLAFLDSLDYQYQSEEDNYAISDKDLQMLRQRKADFLAGKTTSRPWSEIKKNYEGV